jgi:hypothetical protein
MVYLAFLLMPLIIVYVAVQCAIALHVRHNVQVELEMTPWKQQGWQRRVNFLRAELALGRSNPKLSEEDNHATDKYLAEVQERLDFAESKLKFGGKVNVSLWQAVAEAVFMPFSEHSSGTISDGNQTYPYVSPSGLYQSVFAKSGGGIRNFNQAAADAFYWLAMAAVLNVIMPISFIAFVMTLRMHRIRWNHFVRIVVYGAAIPLASFWIMVSLYGLGLIVHDTGFTVGAIMRHFAIFVAPILLFVWWWASVRTYLKLPMPFATALLLLILSYLVVAVCVNTSGHSLWWNFHFT